MQREHSITLGSPAPRHVLILFYTLIIGLCHKRGPYSHTPLFPPSPPAIIPLPYASLPLLHCVTSLASYLRLQYYVCILFYPTLFPPSPPTIIIMSPVCFPLHTALYYLFCFLSEAPITRLLIILSYLLRSIIILCLLLMHLNQVLSEYRDTNCCILHFLDTHLISFFFFPRKTHPMSLLTYVIVLPLLHLKWVSSIPLHITLSYEKLNYSLSFMHPKH